MIDEEALIQENIRNLNDKDIPIVSYFGSGSSLLGSILIKLGMDYIEGYQERILPDKQQTEVVNPYWREHFSILNKKYCEKNLNNNLIRFFKAHHYPESFKNSAVQKVVFLVRDGRDAIISYYNWRVGFAKETLSLNDFLKKSGFFKKKPFDDWASFCEEWVKWGEANSLHIIRYEDLKFNPVSTIKKLLHFVEVDYKEDAVNHSIEETSFAKMRKNEDKNKTFSGNAHIFRKGLVGEWREVLTENDKMLISKKAKVWLEKMGYTSSVLSRPKSDICIIDKDNYYNVSEQIKNIYPDLNVKVIDGLFSVLDLEISLTKLNINCNTNIEIARSVDAVCRVQNWHHCLLNRNTDFNVLLKNLRKNLNAL